MKKSFKYEFGDKATAALRSFNSPGSFASNDQLEKAMNEAANAEDYELAAAIKNYLNERKKPVCTEYMVSFTYNENK